VFTTTQSILSATDVVELSLKAKVGQTAHIQDWVSGSSADIFAYCSATGNWFFQSNPNTSTAFFKISYYDGYNLFVVDTVNSAIGMGSAAPAAANAVTIKAWGTTAKALALKGTASNVADILQIQDPYSTALAGFTSTGKLWIGAGPSYTSGITFKGSYTAPTYAMMIDFEPSVILSGYGGYGIYCNPNVNLTNSHWSGYYSSVNVLTCSGTTYIQGIVVYEPTTVTGTLDTQYGIEIFDMTKATANFAIKTHAGDIVFNEGGSPNADFTWRTDAYNGIFGDASNNSIVLMSDPAGKVGFFGAAAIARATELTDELTTLTFSAPGTPDYAIQDLAAGGYGFVTADEGQSVLAVIANLQTRVNELETKFVAYGLLVDAD
jgi:hypothetical protein